MLGIKIGKTFLKGFETRFLFFIFIQYSSMATATRSETETATEQHEKKKRNSAWIVPGTVTTLFPFKKWGQTKKIK